MSAGRRTGLIVGVRRRDYGVFVVQLRRRRKAGVRRVDFGLLGEVGIFLPLRLVYAFRTVDRVVLEPGVLGVLVMPGRYPSSASLPRGLPGRVRFPGPGQAVRVGAPLISTS